MLKAQSQTLHYTACHSDCTAVARPCCNVSCQTHTGQDTSGGQDNAGEDVGFLIPLLEARASKTSPIHSSVGQL